MLGVVSTGSRDKVNLGTSFDLLHAVEADQLVLHYQPIIDLTSEVVLGMEALVRWNHPVLGLTGPDAFLPLAENSWLGGPLTAWVLERAIADCAAWQAGGSQAGVSVNVFPESLAEEWIVTTVEELLDLYRLAPAALTLELTEKGWPLDLEIASGTLAGLAALGVGISLDDFGTGDSSLSRLQRLDFDEIKIDRCFVAQAAERVPDREIIRFTAELAHALGRRAVAEGVERSEDLDVVRRMGIDAAQGFLLGRPAPIG
jgi:EAL domain-containing protein (putative c-di-GMP-specific phosphodiesterase class I)